MDYSPPGPPCPSPTPGVHPNSCPLSQWCHWTTSSSVVPFSSHLQSFLASGFLLISQLFASGGQRIGVSASTSVLPMNIQDWFPLGWTGWISLLSKYVWVNKIVNTAKKPLKILNLFVFFVSLPLLSWLCWTVSSGDEKLEATASLEQGRDVLRTPSPLRMAIQQGGGTWILDGIWQLSWAAKQPEITLLGLIKKLLSALWVKPLLVTFPGLRW